MRCLPEAAERSQVITDKTPHLNLTTASLSDPFVTNDYVNNWNKIDNSPGDFICTSTTRPAWGTQNIGQSIAETDTGLSWKWDGTRFNRRARGGSGLLYTTSGKLAENSNRVDLTTAVPTYVVVTAVTGVMVPVGNRPIKITVSYASVDIQIATGSGARPEGKASLAIFRSAVANSGTMETSWIAYGGVINLGGAVNPLRSPGGTFSTVINAGLPAGTYDWSLQVKNQQASTSMLSSTGYHKPAYPPPPDSPYNRPTYPSSPSYPDVLSTSLVMPPQIFVEEL
jgi:hypothetical protein